MRIALYGLAMGAKSSTQYREITFGKQGDYLRRTLNCKGTWGVQLHRLVMLTFEPIMRPERFFGTFSGCHMSAFMCYIDFVSSSRSNSPRMFCILGYASFDFNARTWIGKRVVKYRLVFSA